MGRSETDALGLDVHNGLLLSALCDAAFDAGLVSFADDGTVLRSPNLTADSAAAPLTGLTDLHCRNLVRYRVCYRFEIPRNDQQVP